nr:nonribosomal peptide synthetase dtxs1 [Quercus suber]
MNISFQVEDVLDYVSSDDLAAGAISTESGVEHLVQAWSLSPDLDRERVESEVRKQCKLPRDGKEILDVYPATAHQEGLIALAIGHPSSYFAEYRFALAKVVDVGHFKAAWAQVLEACPILRTRMVLIDARSWQVVLAESVRWETSSWKDDGTIYGQKLCSYTLHTDSTGHYFHLRVHHAIFDEWCLGLVSETLAQCYHDGNASRMSLIPFANYVNYALDVDTLASREYWKSELKAAKPTVLPRLQQLRITEHPNKTFRHNIDFLDHQKSFTTTTILRAAWALVLAAYDDFAEDVIFGCSVVDRQAPIDCIERIAGPVLSTVPVRIAFDYAQPVIQFLQNIQLQAAEMNAFEHLGLMKIAKLGPDEQAACQFSTLLVIQQSEIQAPTDDGLLTLQDPTLTYYENNAKRYDCPLVLQGYLCNDKLALYMTCEDSVLNREQVERMAVQYDHVVQQLLSVIARSDSACALEEITLCGPRDIEQVRKWNNEIDTEVVSSCFHILVEEQARVRPSAPAISAWDGEFSYRDLNVAADRLAYHLITRMQVVTGDLVILCFQKSAWAYVAMLAVNKAGGAWVPLDPSHPSQRHSQVVDQAGARVGLASCEHAGKCRLLLDNVVEVSAALDRMLVETARSDTTPPADLASPHDAAYVLFTSGTTGTPKGIVMEHRALCTSQIEISRRLGLAAERVRLLQFAAYVFDLSIGEIVAPLISGGCVCVPSEHERVNDLAAFMRRMKVNWAFLTPSFVRLIKPKDVPGLELLLLAGEPVGQDHLDTWIGKLRLLNGWGPSETCCFSTLQEWGSADESPMTVGRPVGGYCWIVEPDNFQQLAPVGCAGEVVIQGPTIAREYLAFPEGTARNFITDIPAWAPKQDSECYRRFYKSGDLAYYNADGTIQFVTRLDTQVKIRGFRVELGEIEHRVRESLDGVQQVVVDVLEASARRGGPSLVAYMCFSCATQAPGDNAIEAIEGGTDCNMLLPLDREMSHTMSVLVTSLSVHLPSYMLPTLFVPLRYMPTTTSQKTDRRRLRRVMNRISSEQRSQYMLANTTSTKKAPATEMEVRCQRLWADVLGLAAETIGRDDSFLQLGGDSIAAIRLVAAARRKGIQLTVSLIFKDPRLRQVAASAGAERASIEHDIWEQCRLADAPISAVLDVYPTTALQEGLMALAVKQPGSYTARYTFALAPDVDIERFKVAWAQTMQACAALRTRIVFSGGRFWQVVVDGESQWGPADNVSLHVAEEIARPMEYGSALCRYTLLSEDGKTIFALTLHHAIFDGWSLGLILQTLSRYFDGDALADAALAPYVGFVEYAQGLDTTRASEYWRTQLTAATRPVFPKERTASAAPSGRSSTSGSFSHKIVFTGQTSSLITRATILRAAWAIVLARYNDNTDDITFGAAVAGRQAPVNGIESMVGPVISTVPVRVKLPRQLPVAQFLRDVQTQGAEMIPFEQMGLQNIAKLGSDAREACAFSTLFVIQPRTMFSSTGNSLLVPSADLSADAGTDLATYFTYPLVAQCHLGDQDVVLQLIYDSAMLSAGQLETMARQYEHVIEQLLFFQHDDASAATLGDVDVCGPSDLAQVLRWNDRELQPVVVDACVHDIISDTAARLPQREAIFAWDGRCSYVELEEMSAKLAAHLRELGVGVESLVPICFEKSMWTVVAMLAIMKAGGAFVPLNPSHPPARRHALIAGLHAPLMLASPATAEACADIALPVVYVSASLLLALPKAAIIAKPVSTPANVAYVLFTSGSTGTPKGVVIEHRSLASTISLLGPRIGLDKSSRVLQFSSYVFDVSVGEIFATLLYGGSVCVPSEDDRIGDLEAFIRNAEVDTMMLTPSFAGTLTPMQIPSVRSVVLAGEAPKRDVVQTWVSAVRLMNNYGPAETCIYATSQKLQDLQSSPSNIGRGCNTSLWIVEPDNHDRLAPVGCIGELLIQGPGLAREYLNDEEKTACAFIYSPSWLPPSPFRRLYKTGDLARYNDDGTIDYVGRKDVQIKLRGQRVEPGEIEYHVIQHFGPGADALVQMMHGLLTAQSAVIVVFICIDTQAARASVDAADVVLKQDFGGKDVLRELNDYLSAVLPDYMVPTYSFPVHQLPLTSSGKIDAQSLRLAVMSLTTEELAQYSATQRGRFSAPVSVMERALQELWADVLGLAAETIGRDDSFLQLGGDSIAAIRLVAAARRKGIQLTVSLIFKDPRLRQVAASAGAGKLITEEHLEPWSLVPTAERASIEHDIWEQCRLADAPISAVLTAARRKGIQLTVSLIFKDPRLRQVAASAGAGKLITEEHLEPWSLVPTAERASIEHDIWEQCRLADAPISAVLDVYPTTALQEGLMALAVKQPGSYTARYTFALAPGVDVERFKVAWTQTMQACPVLRTRIVFSGGTSWQAVVDGASKWGLADGLSSQGAEEMARPMEYGSALCRYTLLSKGGNLVFALTLHHAIFDGWSLGLILQTLDRFFDGDATSDTVLTPYVGFVKYARGLDTTQASEYWGTQLTAAIRPVFPRERAAFASSLPSTSGSVHRKIVFASQTSSSITMATILRAAWAIVLARYNDNTDDITFGAAVAGRQAPVNGIESMVGPVISTVPVRVKLPRQQPVAQFLRDVQAQGAEMIPFEQMGLQNIAKLGSDAREACAFSTLFVIQPRTMFSSTGNSLLVMPSADLSAVTEIDLATYFTYPLVAQCHLGDRDVVLQLIYDSAMLSAGQLETMARQYEHVIEQLLFFQHDDASAATLDDVDVCGPSDLAQVLQWNDREQQPVVVDACVHDIISDIAARLPQQEAIFAWDGQCSYAQLEEMSTKLAAHLRELGVGVESLVPICFEKSMWTVVAMLAIMKAGGAFVPLNPSHPPARRHALIAGLHAPLMLASSATAEACADIALPVVYVSASLLLALPEAAIILEPVSTPANVAYVLFTSGSTGIPKGVVMEHRALASSINGHGSAFSISQTSRVLQFSSYIFDACLIEIFTTLSSGGSVCIPSDEARLSGVAGFIESANVNWALLTPSFVQSLDPTDAPKLETLVLGGEAPTRENVETWFGNVRLINAYGPAEACIVASSHNVRGDKTSPATIGRGCNTVLWIVEPNNHDRLAPVGCIGELLIQGPGLAREYLNDTEKTAGAFIQPPPWLPPSFLSRLYKTGDLVRYNTDGSIDYMGRKDVQIKIRGQRVEPGEIEHHIKNLLPVVAQVAVVSDIKPARQALVAFVRISSHRYDSTVCKIQDMNGSLRDTFLTLVKQLAERLPAYMVPAYYIPLTNLPVTTSGKVDGKFLHSLLAGLSVEAMSCFSMEERRVFRAPYTETESSLRSLWSQVLDIRETEIGIDDNFYRLGGDSIKIVSLVGLIKRQYGVSLSRDLLNSNRTTIHDIASFVAKAEAGDEGDGALPRVDLIAEFNRLWRDIRMPHVLPNRYLARNSNVFLTGGTGYLGTQILKQLVQHSHINKVIVLVRAQDTARALERLKKSAHLAKWWSNEYLEKIRPWIGDLGRVGFGLTHNQWKILNGLNENEPIHAIIHNGAMVEWTANYSALRPTNVDSTVQLLNIMLNSPTSPKMVYVSGGVKVHMAERHAMSESLACEGGYSQTKFLSEALVQECTTRLPPSQNLLSIVKPGFIIGSPEDGVANTDDLVWRIVAGSARIRMYPTEAEHWMSISDVDAIVSTILDQLTLDSPSPFVDIEAGIPMTTFWHTVESVLPISLQSTSWEHWISTAHLDLATVGETHPLWPVQQFLGELGSLVWPTEDVSKAEIDRVRRALKQNVAYLLDVHFIRRDLDQSTNTPDAVFKRSGKYI